MLALQATRECGQTPRLVYALEELDLRWTMTWQPDGHFMTTYGQSGPLLVDGALNLFLAGPITRHAARKTGRLLPSTVEGAAQLDHLMDYYLTALRTSMMALAQKREGEVETMKRALTVVERILNGRDWLVGEFTIVDCVYSSLSALSRHGVSLEGLPALEAYLKRIAARPAWAASLERLAAARAQ